MANDNLDALSLEREAQASIKRKDEEEVLLVKRTAKEALDESSSENWKFITKLSLHNFPSMEQLSSHGRKLERASAVDGRDGMGGRGEFSHTEPPPGSSLKGFRSIDEMKDAKMAK